MRHSVVLVTAPKYNHTPACFRGERCHCGAMHCGDGDCGDCGKRVRCARAICGTTQRTKGSGRVGVAGVHAEPPIVQPNRQCPDGAQTAHQVQKALALPVKGDGISADAQYERPQLERPAARCVGDRHEEAGVRQQRRVALKEAPRRSGGDMEDLIPTRHGAARTADTAPSERGPSQQRGDCEQLFDSCF